MMGLHNRSLKNPLRGGFFLCFIRQDKFVILNKQKLNAPLLFIREDPAQTAYPVQEAGWVSVLGTVIQHRGFFFQLFPFIPPASANKDHTDRGAGKRGPRCGHQ
jgi:hypothetical protein